MAKSVELQIPGAGSGSRVLETAQILIVDAPRGRSAQAADTLRRHGLSVHVAPHPEDMPTILQNARPNCLIVPLSLLGGVPGMQSLRAVDGDARYGRLSIIATLTPDEWPAAAWTTLHADEILLTTATDEELLARVQRCLARERRDQNLNPVTGLPGNAAILREAEARLQHGEPFAMAYLDLDHFKPFNDKYGFPRGDEVLRMTARLVVNAVHGIQAEPAFVAHTGADDFMFMAPSGRIGPACDELTRNFDLLIPDYYDEEDRIRGAIHAIDRQGDSTTYPLMTCSIAVVDTGAHTVKYVADISTRAAQVKDFTKTLRGSVTCFDRRT